LMLHTNHLTQPSSHFQNQNSFASGGLFLFDLKVSVGHCRDALRPKGYV
jgi:hypothetical protein